MDKLISTAINLLYEKESFLMENVVNERAITHKLAEKLQKLFFDWDVDCEYNRIVNSSEGTTAAKKIMLVKAEYEKVFGEEMAKNKKWNDDLCSVSVYPDIIIHKRGFTDNYIVIEVKLESSGVSKDDYDKFKLTNYTNPEAENGLNYAFGYFIKLGKTRVNCIIPFANGIEQEKLEING